MIVVESSEKERQFLAVFIGPCFENAPCVISYRAFINPEPVRYFAQFPEMEKQNRHKKQQREETENQRFFHELESAINFVRHFLPAFFN